MDFYFKKSQPYASKYNPKELHIFRKEMMTNIFQSMIFIENGLHDYLLVGSALQYKALIN